MSDVRSATSLALTIASAVSLSAACNGSPGSSPIAGPAQNVQPITVDAGPANNYTNGLFTSVTICVPGSAANCQTIGGVLVDTGSSGLRILSSVVTLPLPRQTGSSGNPTVECFPFQDSYTWGPVQLADIKIAGEQANAVPVQVIGASGLPAVPDACNSSGLMAEDTLDTLGANGILGIGPFRQDCGIGCAIGGSSNPGIYYTCSSASCAPAVESLSQQLQNPVWLFTSDNNGVIVELPSVSPMGATNLAGSLVFGIGTESNNALGGATVFTLDSQASFTTIYQGQAYGGSFIDTGSNGIYFLDSGTTQLPLCTDDSSFYCPSAAQGLSATNRGTNGVTGNVTFTIANADAIFANPIFFVSSGLGGPNPGTFDWGLPFVFGRHLFTAIESQTTPAGPGPYFAY